MIDDVIKTLKAHLYERASSPLFGAFFVSWCLWNYRFLMVIFSSFPVQEKFQLIESTIFVDKLSYATRGLILPLITTVLVIFVYPYPAKLVYGFWRRRQKELKEIRQKIEDETPLTIEESRAIRREALNLEMEYHRELKAKDDEIRRLRELLEAEEKVVAFEETEQIKPINKKSDEEEVSEEQLQILSYVAEQGSQTLRSNILQSSQKTGVSQVKTEYNIGELERYGYLSRSFDAEFNDARYEITHKGRTALVDYGKY